jgi:hypothetical protein
MSFQFGFETAVMVLICYTVDRSRLVAIDRHVGPSVLEEGSFVARRPIRVSLKQGLRKQIGKC